MGYLLISLAFIGCSPAPDDEWYDAGDGQRVTLCCRGIQSCYVAANLACEMHEELCGEYDQDCRYRTQCPADTPLSIVIECL